MSGPPPKPTRLKLLNGNPGQRKLNDKDPSLRMKAEVPPRPGNLRDKEARNEWARLVKLLKGTGILTRVDQKSLAMYANTWSYYREAEKTLNKEGFTLYSSNGTPMHNPAISILHKARTDLMKLLQEFGMTPSSRTRIHALPEEKADPFESFLDSKTA